MSDSATANTLRTRFSAADLQAPAFEKNQTDWLAKVEAIERDRQQLLLGGGKSAIAKQHEKARLTARERIELVCDPGAPFHELMQFAAWELYGEWGGPPERAASPASGSSPAGVWNVHAVARQVALPGFIAIGAFIPKRRVAR